MTNRQKLELTWIGKDKRPKLEPRILVEEAEKSYHARQRVSVRDIFDNQLIFGDNLLALKALEAECAGKVKCVFIDPPYNTGSAFTHYDDGLEHSIWLGLMRDRLEIIRRLLAEDGSLWITIDDNEAHYLKVLCDEVFGRANFIANMVWEKRTSRENRRVFSFNHDHLLVYAKTKGTFECVRNPLGLNNEVLSRYKNPDNDPRGPWQSVSANAQAGHATASQFYSLTLPSGRELSPPKGRCWLYTKERMQREIAAGNIWFGANGDNAPRLKKFLKDNEDKGLTPETIWTAAEVGTNDDAKKGLLQLLPSIPVFDNPKPESLIERVIHIATNPGGVTSAVNWSGGGGFRYYRLAPSLLEKDRWGNWVVNPEYNAAMLAEAVCKLEGFSYAPSETHFWQHGHSSESDFIYVTTQTLGVEQLVQLAEEVGETRSLLVCCGAFRGLTAVQAGQRWPNLTLKKLPKMVLSRCEWGHDDYSLNVANLPMAAPEPEPEAPRAPALSRKGRGSKAAQAGASLDLFGEGKESGE